MANASTLLPPDLLRKVDRLIDAGSYLSRADLLRSAVRDLVDRNDSVVNMNKQSRLRLRRYRAVMRKAGQDPRYSGRYVAVADGEVVDSDESMEVLTKRVLHRGPSGVQMGLADPGGRLRRVRV